jgi:hypothetical protein
VSATNLLVNPHLSPASWLKGTLPSQLLCLFTTPWQTQKLPRSQILLSFSSLSPFYYIFCCFNSTWRLARLLSNRLVSMCDVETPSWERRAQMHGQWEKKKRAFLSHVSSSSEDEEDVRADNVRRDCWGVEWRKIEAYAPDFTRSFLQCV